VKVGEKTISFDCGSGYHDHNWGNGLAGFENWYAIHAKLGPYTFTAIEALLSSSGSFGQTYLTEHSQTLIASLNASSVTVRPWGNGAQYPPTGYYPNPLAADRGEAEPAITHLYRVIDAAAALGVGVVNSFVGRDPTLSVEANWPRFLEVWRPIVDHAESRGVRIGIENCPMLFTADEWPGGKNLATTPAIWRALSHAIPPCWPSSCKRSCGSPATRTCSPTSTTVPPPSRPWSAMVGSTSRRRPPAPST